MANKKVTKRALLASVLALVMCISMLVGSTYAWFTDSVSSVNNVIKAGNLDVVLEYKNSWDDDWAVVDGNENLFDENALYEPGYTEVVFLRVSNAGTLALKYQLDLQVISEKSSTNVYGEEFYLSDYIQAGAYFQDEYIGGANYADILMPTMFGTREAAKSNIHNFAALETVTYTDNSVLLPGEDTAQVMAIVLHMPETVGNEANHKTGVDAPEINLGVNLLATQHMYEDDSFGNDYDKDALFGTYIELEAGADLLAAMASAEAGLPLTISLNGDVEWPTDGHHGENDITAASSIVVVGNGHTITATGSGVTPLGDNDAPMTLKDVKVVDNSVSYNESAWELSYLEMGGQVLNCVDVDFADPIQVEADNSSFVGCSFTGHNDKNSNTTQYGVWAISGTQNYNGCTFTGTRGMKVCDSNTSNSYADADVNVTVDGCTFSNLSEKPGVAIDYSGDADIAFAVAIKNSTFINCQAGDQGLYVYETDNYVPAVENNTVLNNATVVSTKDEFLAYSAKALTGNNGVAEEATIVIGADIDMQNADFSAIIAQRGDKLNIVGNGHKIYNVNVVSGANDNTTGQASMFYAYPNSTLTVSNLTLENIKVTADANGSGYAAAVLGYCEGNAILNNVDVVNAEIIGVKSSGMLVGHLSGSLVAKDCDLSGTVTLADFAEEPEGHYAGKYIGTLAGPATLTDCTVNATLSGSIKAANLGDVYGRATAAGSVTVD